MEIEEIYADYMRYGEDPEGTRAYYDPHICQKCGEEYVIAEENESRDIHAPDYFCAGCANAFIRGTKKDQTTTKHKRFFALTLHQPYANLIAAGVKRYETRHWRPLSMSPGSILMIHAAKANNRQLRDTPKFLRARFPVEVDKAFNLFPQLAPRLPLGKIVCAVRYIDCHKVEAIRDTLSESERAFGNYKDGRYAWELELLKVAHPPIPAVGKQSIWMWEANHA